MLVFLLDLNGCIFLFFLKRYSFVFLSQVFKLTYEDWDPNFFEVFIKKPGEEFTLILENASGPVWSCDIRRGPCSSFQKHHDQHIIMVVANVLFSSHFFFIGDYSGSVPFVPEMRTYGEPFCLIYSCIDLTENTHQNKILLQ